MNVDRTSIFAIVMSLAVALPGCAQRASAPAPQEPPAETLPEDRDEGDREGLDVNVDVGDGGVQVDVGENGVNVDVGADGVKVDVGDDAEPGAPSDQP